MKNIAYIFAFLFIAFISVPTVVMLIDKEADIAYVFNFTEEEEHSHSKKLGCECPWESIYQHYNALVYVGTKEKTNRYFYLLRTQQVYYELLSPPPEHIS